MKETITPTDQHLILKDIPLRCKHQSIRLASEKRANKLVTSLETSQPGTKVVLKKETATNVTLVFQKTSIFFTNLSQNHALGPDMGSQALGRLHTEMADSNTNSFHYLRPLVSVHP